jgi:hypothetical protein
MARRRLIIYLGAPSVDDVLKNWSGEDVESPIDSSELPEFTINPSQRTTDIVWRHLVNPADDVESLSQELAETTVDASRGDLYLERSLQIFTNRYDNDVDENEDDEMDLCHPSEYSELTISTPILAGYDFDINEISELEDLPDATSVLSILHKKYSIIVAVVEISPCQLVTTKFGKSISLIKLVVADQTCANFEIACWDQMASFAQTMRVNDIIHLRGISGLWDELIWTDIGLTEFRGVVSAGTRRNSRASILYRCRRLHKEDDGLRPRLDLMDQQTRFVRRLRDWVIRKSAIMARDVPPTLETQES